MADLINIITSKPNWETKITDAKIVKKWKSELVQQNVNEIYLDLVIDLLKQYQKSKENEYEDDCDYDWVVELGVNANDIGIARDCKCVCNVCQMKERNENDSDSDDNNDDDTECTCTENKLVTKKRNFMLGFISQNNNLINPKIKNAFLKNVVKFQHTVPLDFHPGSNNQVVDLVHPSMYCYVKGVTPTKKTINKNIIFQWLPSEFNVDNGKVSIKSYINNLDPVNVDLYVSIANIFEKFVPKFEEVMLNSVNLFIKQNRMIKHGIKKYVPLSKCQVIVKLADTILTPESSVFPSGSWHLEGLPYEKIIATGIYYYEMSNITQNFLNFRSTMTTSADVDYPQDSPKFVETHYGFDGPAPKDSYGSSDSGSIIDLGQVETKEDLCLVFPNFMQHQVSDFELLDKNKIGTRKILVFFLIDPSTRILSTIDVKQQQSTMSASNAQVFRELLMFQRKYEISDQSAFFERGWSLCEH